MCTGTSLLYKIPCVVVGENVTFRSTGEHLFPENNVEVVLVQDERCIQVTFIEFAQLHWIVIKLYLFVLNLSPSLIVRKFIIFWNRPKLFSVFVATKLRYLTHENYFPQIMKKFIADCPEIWNDEWMKTDKWMYLLRKKALQYIIKHFFGFVTLTVTIVFHQSW